MSVASAVCENRVDGSMDSVDSVGSDGDAQARAASGGDGMPNGGSGGDSGGAITADGTASVAPWLRSDAHG